jgi:hypothetical protein
MVGGHAPLVAAEPVSADDPERVVSSETSFVDMGDWDACVDPMIRPVASDKCLPVWIGIDASVKHDSTAIVVVAWSAASKRVVLVSHRIFQPSPEHPLNFEQCVENVVKDYARQFLLRGVFFDPYQMVSVAQRLTAAGIPMREFNQSGANLTVMGNNLFELIRARQLVVYPDKDIRMAVSRTVAKETARGLQITKEKSSYKIDCVVALAMAALAAVEQGQRDGPLLLHDPIALAPRLDAGLIDTISNPVLGEAAAVAAAGPSICPANYAQAPGRRAQPPSRLAVATRLPQTLPPPGHALTAASTASGCPRSGQTGQLVCYITRTTHLLTTSAGETPICRAANVVS